MNIVMIKKLSSSVQLILIVFAVNDPVVTDVILFVAHKSLTSIIQFLMTE